MIIGIENEPLELIETDSEFLNFYKVVNQVSKDYKAGQNYVVTNKKNNLLGYINHYPKWNKFVFTSNEVDAYIILDAGCMMSIAMFIEKL